MGENGLDSRMRTVAGSGASTSVTSDQLALARAPLHVAVPLERELHGGGIHGRPVVELDPRAKLDGHRLPAVGEAGHLGGELRVNVQVLVDLVELLAHGREHDPPDVRSRDRRVQDVRVLVQRDHQGLLLRLRRGGRHEDCEQDRQHEPQPDPHRRCPPHSMSWLIKARTPPSGRWPDGQATRTDDRPAAHEPARAVPAPRPGHRNDHPDSSGKPSPGGLFPSWPRRADAGADQSPPSRPRARRRSPRSAARSRPRPGCRGPVAGPPSAPRARRAPAPRPRPRRASRISRTGPGRSPAP